MAFDYSDLQGARFQEDLQAATSYKPILKEDLKQAYKRYEKVGVKLGRVRGKSDAQLYKQATADVIKWYKLQKAQAKAPTGTAPNSANPKGSATPPKSSSSGGSGGSSSGSGGRGSSGYGGPMLPDTAMNAKPSTTKRLPSIPRPLTRAYMNEMYARFGIVGANPPPYVLKNKDTFDAWIQRVIRKRPTGSAAPRQSSEMQRRASVRTSQPRLI